MNKKHQIYNRILLSQLVEKHVKLNLDLQDLNAFIDKIGVSRTTFQYLVRDHRAKLIKPSLAEVIRQHVFKDTCSFDDLIVKAQEFRKSDPNIRNKSLNEKLQCPEKFDNKLTLENIANIKSSLNFKLMPDIRISDFLILQVDDLIDVILEANGETIYITVEHSEDDSKSGIKLDYAPWVELGILNTIPKDLGE